MLVILILAEDRVASYAAATVFVIGAATDRLDGYLARRFESQTRTGAWLDPLADKLFVLSPVVTLAILRRLPAWAAAIFVLREVAVSALRARLGMRGQSMPATALGKWKTAAQMLAILLYLLPLDGSLGDVRFAVLLAAAGLTVWSGVDYFTRVRR